MTEPLALTPGAPRAKRLGCLCPVIDNHHGLGHGRSENGPVYVIRCDCPMHGDEAPGGLFVPSPPQPDGKEGEE